MLIPTSMYNTDASQVACSAMQQSRSCEGLCQYMSVVAQYHVVVPKLTGDNKLHCMHDILLNNPLEA